MEIGHQRGLEEEHLWKAGRKVAVAGSNEEQPHLVAGLLLLTNTAMLAAYWIAGCLMIQSYFHLFREFGEILREKCQFLWVTQFAMYCQCGHGWATMMMMMMMRKVVGQMTVEQVRFAVVELELLH